MTFDKFVDHALTVLAGLAVLAVASQFITGTIALVSLLIRG